MTITCERNSTWSDSSSVSSDKSNSFNHLKPTKHCVFDFFNCVTSIDKPVNSELYTFGHWNTTELFNLVKSFMPDILDVYSPAQVADWLSKDGRFGHSQVARIRSKRERRRSMWIIKDEHWASVESHGWIDIGYARKSRTNEPVESKVKSMQKMTDCLRIKCHCAKVYLSFQCPSASKLQQRDTKPYPDLMESVRHKHGDKIAVVRL
ncbi:uncharacterized protein EV154DRAFT_552683 [Mucor mucedo]|uniref:uncharacterized protein n=1 Tax=Mucor mucedo TaxID=29922 RepID=UPI00221F1D44|nr:uncharacterized protein EV154DRAFT_552683 [Mucor mucedo]KAI7889829.1 hypothetical protein EV154DRAFT_552683 [Mucor mucedo]